VLHGTRSLVLQDANGQIQEAHSISAGLDYPGVGPELAYLAKEGRLEVRTATDDEALRAFYEVARTEGILPALETSHAFARAADLARELGKGKHLVINCSGRGGEERYAKLAREKGVSGTILPDLPPEESEGLRRTFDAVGLDLIPLCAPTTPPARAEAIAKNARGFVYCVSVAGVTGMRAELPKDLSSRLELVRRSSPVPVVAGFGISNAEQARTLSAHADGVVVGSALVRTAHADGPAAAKQLCAEIKRGLK
jgi:tryptophan synthase alpha subunit